MGAAGCRRAVRDIDEAQRHVLVLQFEQRNGRLLFAADVDIPAEADGQLIGRLPLERNASAEAVLVALAAAVEQTLLVAVAGFIGSNRAHCEIVAQRHVDHALEIGAVEPAGRRFELQVKFVLRLDGIDDDRAADGVLAEQRALRPAQDLHISDVGHVEQRTDRAGDIDAIDIDAHAGIHGNVEVGLTDAADERGDRGAGTGDVGNRRHVHVGRELGHLGDVVDFARFEHLGIHSGDRDRRFLQVLRPLARSHDDFT